MVIFVLPFETFPKCKGCTFALRPLNPFIFATEFCKFKWGHNFYGFGVEKCKDSNGDVHLVFVQLKWTWCNHLTISNLAFFFFAFFQLQCMLESCSSDHASVIPCHLQLFASSN